LKEFLIYFWGQGYPITSVMESRTPKKFVKLVKMHVLYMMYPMRVLAGKHLSVAFLFHNRLKTMFCPSWFLVSLLQHVRKVQENQEEQHLNGLNQLLFYSHGVNMLGEE
jgi:hypothetical protein